MGQADVLRWLEEHPGWHDANAIAEGAKIRLGNVYKTTATLRRQKRIGYKQEDGAFLYRLPVRASRPLKLRDPTPKPMGRAGRSAENRVGQAWKAGSKMVLVESIDGAERRKLPDGHFQCPHCLMVQKERESLFSCLDILLRGEIVVRIEERGFAVCVNCGRTYNDGKVDEKMSNRERKRRKDKLIYDCKHNNISRG